MAPRSSKGRQSSRPTRLSVRMPIKYIYGVIKDRLGSRSGELEVLFLLMANAATITAGTIDEGVRVLRANPEIGSAVAISCYNMWSLLVPARKTNMACYNRSCLSRRSAIR